MKTVKYCAGVALAAALLVSTQAAATLINFEDAPSHGLHDNDATTSQYLGNGVTFSGGYLERAGGSDGGDQGFVNDLTMRDDDIGIHTFASHEKPLGNWFLRSHGSISSRGGHGKLFLSVFYATPVNGASGQIWDIDGNSRQGSEQWKVVAYSGGQEVTFDQSDAYDTAGPESLNARPWTFNLVNGGGFDRIDFIFTGTKTWGVGLAFDNFNTTSADLPEPGALGMFGLGVLLAGLLAGLRRRMA